MQHEAVVCGKTVLLPDLRDLQQVLDYVVLHLRRQNRPSTENGGEHCAYRSDTADPPLSCAVGCLIPDSAYDDTLEENAADARCVMDAVLSGRDDVSDLPREHRRKLERLLEALQAVHDHLSADMYSSGQEAFDQKRLVRECQLVATCFGLCRVTKAFSDHIHPDFQPKEPND